MRPSRPSSTSAAAITRARSRRGNLGASVVGTLIAVGVVVMVGLALAASLGGRAEETGRRQADCIGTWGCSGGAGSGSGSSTPPPLAERGRGPGGGFLAGAVDVGKGFVVDGLGGAISGVAAAVTDPIGTVQGLGHVIAHPIDTANAVRAEFQRAWEENPQRAFGAAAFELLTLPVGATKGPRVAAIANSARRAGEAADTAVDAGRTARAAEAACPGGTCGVPGGSCFAPGTPVVTPAGARPIEKLEVGDEVLARDPETGVTEPRPITRIFVTLDQPVLDLGIETPDGRVDHLRVTPEHPFWREGSGFIGAGELAPGEHVRTETGTARVIALASLPDKIAVYNVEVDVAHTYFVGKDAAWVHNACARVLQTGGHKMEDRTARELNRDADRDLTPREWGRALEHLKHSEGLPPNYHGRLMSNGDYVDPATGKVHGNIHDHVP